MIIMKIKAQIKLKGTSKYIQSLIHSRQVFSKLNQVLSPFIPPSYETPWRWRFLHPPEHPAPPGRVFPINPTGVSLAGACSHCLPISCCAPLKKAWLHLFPNPALGSKGLQFNLPQSFLLKGTNPVPSASPGLFPPPNTAVAFTGLAPVCQSLTCTEASQWTPNSRCSIETTEYLV